MPAPPGPLELLLPRPKLLRAGAEVADRGGLRLTRGGRVALALSGGADERARVPIEAALERLGICCAPPGASAAPLAATPIDLRLEPGSDLPAQGYRLEVDGSGARLVGGDPAGLFHAAVTLAQVVRLVQADSEGEAASWLVPCLQIEDAPDFPHRGFMLDVSRDRVPTMETLRALVEQLAALKYNQLQLYIEHTFAYAGHEEVWDGSGALTPQEMRDLDALCRERHIELVPSQQSFGHMHRWLVHPRYRALAECPEGIEHAFSVDKEPFSLCPGDPGTYALLGDLYDQLLPCFSSGLVNVGLDETFDLGLGRSSERCGERGVGRVYLEHLQRVHGLVRERGKRMQFWGDIVVQHPELVAELPGDAIAMEWGYEAGHPFEEHTRRFAASGLDFYVCPGTSSWQSLAGRVDNARANLSEAARHGRAAGAAGYLVTDWGDFGHWQPLPTIWPGLLLGAAHAWDASAEPPDLARALDTLVLEDRAGAAGAALLALGQVHEACAAPAVNGSALFFLLRYADQPMPIERAAELNLAGLEHHAERLEQVRADLGRHAMARPDAALVQGELEWVIDTLLWAGRLGSARLAAGPGSTMATVASGERARLAAGLRPLIERHRELWPARSRPGGLPESAARFEHLLELLGEPLEVAR